MKSRFARTGTALIGALAGTLLAAGAASAQPAYPSVTQARLDNAAASKGWLMFNRSYAGDDYAPFAQINTKNVASLKPAWSSAKIDIPNGFEGTPIVNGDYMFATTPLDHLIAFNAKTGKKLWEYDYDLPKTALKTVCCGANNRGVAVYGNEVFMGTLDNHVLALDATTGKVLWNVALEKPGIGYSISEAPMIVDGKVIIGSGGGEYGARGFIVGLDAQTGKLLWKTYTIPSPSEPGGKTWPAGAYKHGGGSPWMTGTYDPKTKQLFWGVGNPSPWLASMRPGNNLYSDSVIAIDPNTGAIKWHYQYTRNDTWDYDGVNTAQLADITYKGKPYHALVEANRNGYFYAINRETGKLIYAVPFVHDTSITGIKDGQAVNNMKLRPALDKQIFTCPSFFGGKNWWSDAVDPATNMAYVPTLHACMTMKGVPVSYAAGLPYLGETFETKPDPASPHHMGSIQAIDLSTGKQVWQHRTKEPWTGGAMATSGGLVFSGTADGHLYAFDAKTGKILWKSPYLGSGIVANPMSYEIDGKQYVAVWSGWGGVWPLWSGKLGASLAKAPRGGQLHVFALNG
ncbi:methanol/ethanol family PQQ-dependent dehydrogenase [Acidiphilium multivorum]|uniref:methanol/ethanol family PQQ-dependent dehydrogenase n=1 Tax=Acidiphilium multivorum TaxID=62140 RepID=UPI001B8CD5D5|nr:methanol/ethanol family PQQ-dependent dehydrogenase [Acidiphilium multivorum]MBS3023930.1 PQQ-dependent dehydrogenase, methanol/ethanol family [Acidiphilium multivorum]